MNDCLYSLRKVAKYYGAKTALQIDALELRRGEPVALCGPNGAGKSTLLSLLALVDRPEGGVLHFDGRIVTPANAASLRLSPGITLAHQNPYLLRGPVEKNLACGLKLRGIRGAEARLLMEGALERVGLSGFLRRDARELSGGEAQRAALARALVLEPKVLLLDEPLSGLDAASTASFESLLRDLVREGVTLIFSTHDPEAPERLGARVIRLAEGRLAGMAAETSAPAFHPVAGVRYA